jgi:hypothetical protein
MALSAIEKVKRYGYLGSKILKLRPAIEALEVKIEQSAMEANVDVDGPARDVLAMIREQKTQCQALADALNERAELRRNLF